MTEENKGVPAGPVPQMPQEVNKDAQVISLLNKLVPKWQALNVMVGEVGETLQTFLNTLMPLMNEKNMKIKALEDKVKELEAIAGKKLSEEKKKK
jgi:hypothetical protein